MSEGEKGTNRSRENDIRQVREVFNQQWLDHTRSRNSNVAILDPMHFACDAFCAANARLEENLELREQQSREIEQLNLVNGNLERRLADAHATIVRLKDACDTQQKLKDEARKGCARAEERCDNFAAMLRGAGIDPFTAFSKRSDVMSDVKEVIRNVFGPDAKIFHFESQPNTVHESPQAAARDEAAAEAHAADTESLAHRIEQLEQSLKAAINAGASSVVEVSEQLGKRIDGLRSYVDKKHNDAMGRSGQLNERIEKLRERIGQIVLADKQFGAWAEAHFAKHDDVAELGKRVESIRAMIVREGENYGGSEPLVERVQRLDHQIFGED